jgi:peptide/nickel transport system substrate-binding protein
MVLFFFSAAPPSGVCKIPPDTLIQAWRFDDIISMDPAELFEISAYEIVGNMYDTLYTVNPKKTDEILPRAAEEWSVADDGKTYTFKLKPDMKFHNGDPVTAHDVAYSFRRLAAMDMGPAFLIQDLGITKENMNQNLKAVDDLTFQMIVDENYSPSYVINVICASNFSIINSKTAKAHEKDGDWGNNYLKTNSAGSGPFMLRRWRPDELIIVEANPDYHGGAPALKRLVWRHVAEESSQRLLLESGDVDIARNLSSDQLESLEKKGGYNIVEGARTTSMYMGMNVKHPQLANEKVREAIRWLIDYRGMVETIIRGKYIINQTFLPNTFMGYVDSNPYGLDVEKAKKLLAEAGYPDGGFTIKASVSSTHQDRMDIAQSVQATLAKAGITMEILATDSKTALTTYRARKHDVYIGTWGVDYFDPNTNMVFVVNRDNSDDPKSKPLTWRNSWQNKEFNKRADALLLEKDSQVRKNGYQQLIEDWQPVSCFAMMFQQIQRAALLPTVKNFFIGPTAETTLYLEVEKN